MKRHMISAALIAALTMAFGDGALSSQERSGDLEHFRHRSHHAARMDGFQETPLSLSTTGTGRIRLRIDEDEETIKFDLSYDDLEGMVTAAHIHLGAPGVSGGVSAFFCGGGGKPACPTRSGRVTGVIMRSDVIGPTAQGIEPRAFDELVHAIRAGYTYANVHTTPRYPGGEIRGQIR